MFGDFDKVIKEISDLNASVKTLTTTLNGVVKVMNELIEELNECTNAIQKVDGQ